MRADAVRARVCGDAVTYVVNRNINNTNVCTFSCAFCAFSKVHAVPSMIMLPQVTFYKSNCASPLRVIGDTPVILVPELLVSNDGLQKSSAWQACTHMWSAFKPRHGCMLTVMIIPVSRMSNTAMACESVCLQHMVTRQWVRTADLRTCAHRAGRARSCGTRRTCCRRPRSRGARPRPGSAARQRSASRAASTRTSQVPRPQPRAAKRCSRCVDFQRRS